MSVNPRNACAGFYGDCLDVKLTNKCNAACSFCIERGGLQPKEVCPVEMAMAARSDPADTVLVLGGEPMYNQDRLETFLRYLRLPAQLQGDTDPKAGERAQTRKVYLTTNGCYLNVQTARAIRPYLNGINISLHHYNMALANDVLQLPNDAPHQLNTKRLVEAIEVFHTPDTGGRRVPVRFNVNLVKGWLDTPHQVELFMAFAADTLHADCIRFTELQNCDDLWVNARDIFPDFAHTALSADPFTNGCEVEIDAHPDIQVIVKMACGLVCKYRRPIDPATRMIMRKQAPNHHTRVLYPDGIIRQGWVKAPADDKSEPVLYSGGCHDSAPDEDWDCDCHGPGCH